MNSITAHRYHYRICTDRIADEDGTTVMVYGIEVYPDASARPTLVMRDLFTRRKQAEELVSLCNRLELDPIHLADVIEDALAGVST